MKKFILVALITVSWSAVAQVDRETINLLKRDLQTGVKELSRPIRSFNWFVQDLNSPQIEFFEGNFSQYAIGAVARFWVGGDEIGHVGAGLYAAVTPLDSQHFGEVHSHYEPAYRTDAYGNIVKDSNGVPVPLHKMGRNGQYERDENGNKIPVMESVRDRSRAGLIEVILPMGARFLDLRNGGPGYTFKLSQKSLSKLLPDCPSLKVKLSEVRQVNHVSKQDLTLDKSCANHLFETLRELEISFIAYRWGPLGLSPSYCEPSRDLVAFVITGVPQANDHQNSLSLRGIKMTLFNRTFNSSNQLEYDNYKRINDFTRLYQQSRASIVPVETPRNRPLATWPEFDSIQIDRENVLRQVVPTQFNCTPSLFAEDQALP